MKVDQVRLERADCSGETDCARNHSPESHRNSRAAGHWNLERDQSLPEGLANLAIAQASDRKQRKVVVMLQPLHETDSNPFRATQCEMRDALQNANAPFR